MTGSAISIRSGGRTLAAALCALFSGDALLAQDDPATTDAGAEPIDEIVVTGSRIKRRDFSSPSPIATVDRDSIEFAGQSTVEDMLNKMPQLMPDLGRTSNALGDGIATLNLRGLGPGRTLVMLNGRRLAPSGTGSAVDVNNLPQALIERVEVITGGASAVYGSDAVAGVINFITREDYTGFSFDLNYSLTEKGDAKAYGVDAAYGFDYSRGNLTAYAGLYDRESLFASAREISSVVLVSDTDNGTLVEGGNSANPAGHIRVPRADLGSGPTTVTFNADGTPRPFSRPDDLYNYAPVNYLQVPLRRYSAGLMGTLELNTNYEAYFETQYSRNESGQTLAPVPVHANVTVNTDNPVLTPETRQLMIDHYETSPGFAEFRFSRRMTELGGRIIEHERDYWRTVLGIRGELADGWDIDGWLIYTTADEQTTNRNDASRSLFLQGLLVDPMSGQCFDPSGGCVPIDPFGEGRMSPAAVDFISLRDMYLISDRTQQSASVVVTGAPFATWADPVDMAFGLEWRSDDTTFKADDLLFTGDTLGYRGSSPIEGEEQVVEGYVEALVPLATGKTGLQYLGLELGLRYSEYDHAGGFPTYKLGGEWQPVDGVRFRLMKQRSVRAPNNAELFTEQLTENGVVVGNFYSDPCSASSDPVGNGITEKCILNGLDPAQIGVFEATRFYPVDLVSGGNPELTPEVAETFTVGVVLTPEFLPNWQISIDYFDVEVTDSIGDISAVDICFDPVNIEHEFCTNVRRDTTGNIAEVYQPVSNRGLLHTNGIDTQLNYARDLPDWLATGDNLAQLSANLVWTHTISNEIQQNVASSILDCLGYFGWPCDPIGGTLFYGTLPENRVTTYLNYISGAFSAHLTWRWIEGTNSAFPIGFEQFNWPEPVLAIPSISNKNLIDLGLGYQFADGFGARLVVSNLLNDDPPLMADGAFENNTDATLYDIFGRTYSLRLFAQFGGQ
jgi:outer membrane receptor protein involved in Fe transport